MIELKKCPFCGSDAEIKEVDADFIKYKYWVYCLNDDCTIEQRDFFDLDEAITKWNNRI